MGTLAVLLWKQYIVRKRRILGSLLELISTLAFFILLYCLREQITAANLGFDSRKGIQENEAYSLDKVLLPSLIYYYPETNYTKHIMDKAGPKLLLLRSQLHNSTQAGMYYGIPMKETEIDEYIDNLKYDEAVVIFENAKENVTMLTPLRYTIRMRENFLTNTIKPLTDMDTPHENFATIYEPFMRIQWAIDTSYIELRSHVPITQRVHLQEFPTPRGPIDMSAVIKVVFIKLCCISSLFVTFVYGISRLLEERCTGIQELVKMVGVSSLKLGIAHLLDSIPVGLLYSIIASVLLISSSVPLLHVSFVYLFIFFLLQYFSIVAQAFACSYIIKSSNHAVSFAFMMYIFMMVPAIFISMKYPKMADSELFLMRLAHKLSGLLPQTPVIWWWLMVLINECQHLPTMFKHVQETYVAFLAQIVFYLLLTWYLEKVRPGKWGVPLPWNFFCKKQYWISEKVTPQRLSEEYPTISQERDPVYFEEQPRNMEVGIKISNVYKEFSDMFSSNTNKVLSDVNFDIFKGEITVLLGHNGAGKTTLMSIITGMIKATSGDVYVNGLHTVRDKAKIHKIIGLCPQVNLFFPDLTVLEHVMFFALLKGGSIAEARDSSMELLRKLNLTDRAHFKCSELSGGMKRRVQLTCALAGGAEVLVLDEPTSGLDVETRRELWNLLLSLRGSRTVLLTTHFMEEADALGDRIAVLHGGVVKCHATPMYLKKSIGSGYRLTLNTVGTPLEQKITGVVKEVIKDAKVKEVSIHSISFNLPSRDTEHFPTLFNKLEQQKAELEIAAIGVGVTTLEEVFLQMCKDVTEVKDDDLKHSGIAPEIKKVKGFELTKNRFKALLRRQFLNTASKPFKFAICDVLIPILAIFLVARYTNTKKDEPKVSSRMSMDANMYSDIPARAFYSVNTSLRTGQGSPSAYYPVLRFQRAGDVAKDAYELALIDMEELNKYLVGVQLNDTDAKVMYTTRVRHAAPVGLNLLSNVLASMYTRAREMSPAIKTYNEPVLRAEDQTITKPNTPKGHINILMWSLIISLILMMTLANNLAMSCQERIKGSRNTIVMCGVSQLMFWGTTMLYNMVVYFVTLMLPTVLLTYFLDQEETFRGAQFYVMIILLMFVAGLAYNAFTILVSLLLKQGAAQLCVVIFVYIYSMMTTELENDFLTDKNIEMMYHDIISGIGIFLPPYNFVKGMTRTSHIARFNAICATLKHTCPNLKSNTLNFDSEVCCASGEGSMYSHFSFNMFTPMYSLLFLVMNFFVIMFLVIQVERGIFEGLCSWILGKRDLKEANPFNDPHVQEEKEYVEKTIVKANCNIHDSLLVQNLKKNFYGLRSENNFVVKGIDFSVKRGECFGLLGVNGAGKSTTFKMLTGEMNPTRGKIFAHDCFLTRPNRSRYLGNLSYCPQFFGLDEFLTARQTLTLLLTLRGFQPNDVTVECESWIKIVGLEQYANRRIATYSGGCARRIGTAAALCQRAAVVMLDEPTSGVDPTSRRRVWTALRKGLNPRTSVIITSHSMDEMEALCDRLAVMNAGWLCAVGPVSHLRAEHAQGQSVQIKLRNDIGDESNIDNLKVAMMSTFDLELKDSHRTMLHYHLTRPLAYSELFSKMQQVAQAHPVIEDYSVSETTLEEVFLQLAAMGKAHETA